MRSFVWLGAVLVLGAAACTAQAQVELAWKLKEGDTFWLETVSTSKQTMKTVGRELKQDLEQTTVFAIKVIKIDDKKNVELEQKLEWLVVKTGAADAQPDDRYNTQLAGLSFKVTLNPRGEVVKFEGYEDVVKKIAGDDTNAQKAVKSVLTEESLKQAAAEVFAILPEKPVKTADTWERKLDRPLGAIGALQTLRKYSYDGQETVEGKPLDKLTFTGTATYSKPRADEATPFLFKVVNGEMKVDDLRGNAHFDGQMGRLVKAEWLMRLKGVVTINVSGTNIETEAVQDWTVKTRVLDKAPIRPGTAPPG